jgi:hypothetical protein
MLQREKTKLVKPVHRRIYSLPSLHGKNSQQMFGMELYVLAPAISIYFGNHLGS